MKGLKTRSDIRFSLKKTTQKLVGRMHWGDVGLVAGRY